MSHSNCTVVIFLASDNESEMEEVTNNLIRAIRETTVMYAVDTLLTVDGKHQP